MHLDVAVMAPDDRLGDGQAKARMAPEILLARTVGMEAPEDRFAGLGGNAGPFIVDPDADLVADSRGSDLDQPARRREAEG